MTANVIDIERIDRMIQETEAVKNYATNKKELSDALVRIKDLEEKLSDYESMKRSRDEALAKLADLDEKVSVVITHVLTEMQKPENQRHYDSGQASPELVSLIEEIIDEFVTKRINQAVDNIPLTNFRRAAQSEIDRLLANWSLKLGVENEQRKKLLRQKLNDDPYVVLKREWRVKCDKCGFHTLELKTVGDIKELLQNEKVDVPARAIEAQIYGEHAVSVTLADIVRSYLDTHIRLES